MDKARKKYIDLLNTRKNTQDIIEIINLAYQDFSSAVTQIARYRKKFDLRSLSFCYLSGVPITVENDIQFGLDNINIINKILARDFNPELTEKFKVYFPLPAGFKDNGNFYSMRVLLRFFSKEHYQEAKSRNNIHAKKFKTIRNNGASSGGRPYTSFKQNRFSPAYRFAKAMYTLPDQDDEYLARRPIEDGQGYKRSLAYALLYKGIEMSGVSLETKELCHAKFPSGYVFMVLDSRTKPLLKLGLLRTIFLDKLNQKIKYIVQVDEKTVNTGYILKNELPELFEREIEFWHDDVKSYNDSTAKAAKILKVLSEKNAIPSMNEMWEEIEKRHAEVFSLSATEIRKNPQAFYSKLVEVIWLMGTLTPMLRGTGRYVELWLALVHKYHGLSLLILKPELQLDVLDLIFSLPVYQILFLSFFEPGSLEPFVLDYYKTQCETDPKTIRLLKHFKITPNFGEEIKSLTTTLSQELLDSKIMVSRSSSQEIKRTPGSIEELVIFFELAAENITYLTDYYDFFMKDPQIFWTRSLDGHPYSRALKHYLPAVNFEAFWEEGKKQQQNAEIEIKSSYKKLLDFIFMQTLKMEFLHYMGSLVNLKELPEKIMEKACKDGCSKELVHLYVLGFACNQLKLCRDIDIILAYHHLKISSKDFLDFGCQYGEKQILEYFIKYEPEHIPELITYSEKLNDNELLDSLKGKQRFTSSIETLLDSNIGILNSSNFNSSLNITVSDPTILL